MLRAAAKYGKAVSHVAKMSRHLLKAAGARPVELEVSVDETDTPTTPAEHYWVASELRRLGRRVGQPGAALRRPLREGRRLHRRPRRARDGRRRARRDRPPLRALQAEPALGLRQVQRLPDRRPARARARAPEDGRHELPRGAAHDRARSTPRSSARSTPSPASATTPTRPPTTSRPSSAGRRRPRT